jgi:hypothetical protein
VKTVKKFGNHKNLTQRSILTSHAQNNTNSNNHQTNYRNFKKALKGKAIPLQALTGPEDSRRMRLQILRQSAREGGKVVSPTHRPPWPPLPPGNIIGTHFC